MAITTGGPGNDRIDGDVGDDVLRGGAGDDELTGDYGRSYGGEYPEDLTGNDILYGDDGDDTLIGDGYERTVGDHGQYESLGGSDVIHGGAGDDVIVGGVGDDLLFGDSGADTFVFAYHLPTPEYGGPTNLDSGLGHGSRDVIKDFKVGVDTIELEWAHHGSVTVAQYKPGWAMVKIDVDGDDRTDAQILVHTGLDHVTYADLF